jgi:hypothetical protein
MGDVLAHFSDTIHIDDPNLNIYLCSGPCGPWTSNLQSTVSVDYELGKPVEWTSPRFDERTEHAFFDRTNLGLMTVSLLGQAADAITTQRFISHGLHEGDPLAQPFVKYGWSGQIGLAVLVNGIEISGMYGLHRLHHHNIERGVPLAVATASGIWAFQNDRLSFRKSQ